MKALNLYGKQDVRLENVSPLQIEQDDDVIIHVKTAGICGSDISRFGKIGSYNPGLTWGHEFSGVVAQIGRAVTSVKPGDRVVACPCFPCFTCEYCRQAQYSKCIDLRVLGGHRKGAFAEYVRVPAANVVTIPDELGFEEASFVEPSAVVVHGLNQVSIGPACSVAVVGCGTIGQLALQWARLYGAGAVYALDTDDRKLNIASIAGADAVFNVTAADFSERFKAAIPDKGLDLVIESSGNAAGIIHSINLAKKGGTVLLLGIPYGDVEFDRTSFEKIIRNELTVQGSWNSLSAPFPGKEWKTSLDYMSKGLLKPSLLITHRINIEDVPDIFPKLHTREFHFIKVLIDMQG